MIPSTLVAATGNAHKVEELRSLFALNGVAVSIVPITSVVDSFEVDETGASFEENAYIKAVAGFERCGLPVIADDSGLEVDALNGAPGVFSARYSGTNASDASNRMKLLDELSNAQSRHARFRCVLVLHDGIRTLLAEGSCHGTIAHEERGHHGFGYDALFIPRGYDKTFGELPVDVKHGLSHRATAVTNLVQRLRGEESFAQVTTPEVCLRTAIAVATNDDALLRESYGTITDVHLYKAVYEVVLQCYLFCGFPAALEGLAALNDVARERGWDVSSIPNETFDANTFRQRGEDLCRSIYGSVYDRMMNRLENISPQISEWMIVEGYGKTLARPGLSIIDRECCAVAVLACTQRTTQLISHVRGALANGATREHLHAVIDALCVNGLNSAALLLDETLCRFE
jgi:XTP/dITP diphosphohydrolase